MDQVRKLAEYYFGSISQALATNMIVEIDGGHALTHQGAKLIHFFLGVAKERGVDASTTERLLIEVQALAAIRQAERQFDEP